MLLPRPSKRPNERRKLTFRLDEKPGDPQLRLKVTGVQPAPVAVNWRDKKAGLAPARLSRLSSFHGRTHHLIVGIDFPNEDKS
jgi:hypothetical protein